VFLWDIRQFYSTIRQAVRALLGVIIEIGRQRVHVFEVQLLPGAARRLVTFSCAAKRKVTKEKAAQVRRTHWV